MSKSFNLEGDLTYDTVNQYHKTLKRFIESVDDDAIELDLSQINRSDSAGVALIIDSIKMAREHNKTIELKALPKQMQAMIDFCNLRDVLC